MTDTDPSRKAPRPLTTLPEPDYLPFSMQDAGVRERRTAMLGLEHMIELRCFAKKLRERRPVPDFDPCDGGVKAQALFLLDTPGPKAKNSGFVSSNNPDQTAKNMGAAWTKAELKRCQVLLWNVVPYYVENDSTQDQVREAIPDTQELINKLQNLRVVVFCGRKALMAKKRLRFPLSVIALCTSHTGAMAYNHDDDQQDIHHTFRTAGRLLELLK